MLSDWGPLSELSSDIQKKLERKLKHIILSPGEELYQEGELPPGILYLEEGQIRLLAKDQTGNFFTIQIYQEGEIVGIEQLLRGVPGEIFAASTNLTGLLLPANDFLKVVSESQNLLNSYTTITPGELYSATSLNNDPRIKGQLVEMVSEGVLAIANATFSLEYNSFETVTDYIIEYLKTALPL